MLKRAVDAGVPTVQAGGGFTDYAGTVSNAYISQWTLGEMVARQLMDDLGGKGKIVAMLPIAGTTAAVDQLDALETVLKEFPAVELAERRIWRLEPRQGQADHREPAAAVPEDRWRLLAGRPDVDRRGRGFR